jgi:hypothetical protein
MGCACNRNKQKNENENKVYEKFSNISNYLSNNWILVVVIIIVIIGLLYYFILNNKNNELTFTLVPKGPTPRAHVGEWPPIN